MPKHDNNCKICGGLGWVKKYGGDDIYHPDFGKVIPCPNIPFTQTWGMIPNIASSGLTKDDLRLNKNGLFNVNNIKHNYKKISDYFKDGGMVYLWGGYGLGKTHLAKLFLVEYFKTGNYNGAYTTISEIISRNITGFNSNQHKQEFEVEFWIKKRFLVLDEFDKIRQTQFSEEIQYQVFDSRYRKVGDPEYFTIVISNVSPEKFSSPIQDRLRDGRVKSVNMTGKSVRPGLG